MAVPRDAGGPSGMPSTAARGIILVVVAVVIGFVLLRAGFSGPTVTVTATTTSTATTATTQAGTPGTTAPGGTTDTTAPGGTATTQPGGVGVRPPNEVRVMVANGSGVQGAAARTGDELKAVGYTVLSPTNTEGSVATTAVYYVSGYTAEAQAVAQAIGAPASSVAAMPAPPPVDVQNANVLVVLGSDLAKPA